jgi:hypothetical protein
MGAGIDEPDEPCRKAHNHATWVAGGVPHCSVERRIGANGDRNSGESAGSLMRFRFD